MSIFGSMTTAVLGLTAQSKALGHISDNIANASTVGYKRVNTAFETLVLESNSRRHAPGGVIAQPVFMNNIQGTPTQVQSPTNIAIQGQGFFSVTKIDGSNSAGLVQTQNGTLDASSAYYTRQGDFELDKNRFLVNSAGYALNGWLTDPVTGEMDKSTVAPIQVNSLTDKPIATKTIEIAANLPANPTAPIPNSSIEIYDAQGNLRTINLTWRQQSDNDWRLGIEAPESKTSVLPVAGSFQGGDTNISFGQNIAGRTAVAQVNTVTITGVQSNGQDTLRIGDVYTVNVDGSDYKLKITDENVGLLNTFSGIAGALANEINMASPASAVLATVTGNVIRLEAREAGIGFKASSSVQTSSVTNNTVTTGTPTAATPTTGGIAKFTYPQSQIDIGDSFSLTVQGTPVSVTVTAQTFSTYQNISGITEELANRINALNLGVTATSIGGLLNIQHNVAGTDPAVTADAPVNAAATPSTMIGGMSAANVPGIKQTRTVTLTGNPGDVGATYSVTVNGTPITYTTTGKEMSMEDIANALAKQVNSTTSLPVVAQAQGGVITITAKVAKGDVADQFTLEQFSFPGQTPAHIGLKFGTTPETTGTLTRIDTAYVGEGNAIGSISQKAGSDAIVTFTVDYGFGPQEIELDLGKFQRTGGINQYAGGPTTDMELKTLIQDGTPAGQFKDVVFGASGQVIVNYNNGRSKAIAQVPIFSFNNPNALQRETGGVYLATQESGNPRFNIAGENGAGNILASSLESSNVDIADEFTKLIVTQRTYSANTKIVTTSDEMLIEVLGLKR